MNTKENTSIEIYKPKSGQPYVEVTFTKETVWLSQQQIADLFCIKKPAITKHIENVFKSGEFIENSVNSVLKYSAYKCELFKQAACAKFAAV